MMAAGAPSVRRTDKLMSADRAVEVPAGIVIAALTILLAIGFLPALIFSWIFEVTSEGLKRDADVLPDQSIAPQTARRMDRSCGQAPTTQTGIRGRCTGIGRKVIGPNR